MKQIFKKFFTWLNLVKIRKK